MANGAFPGAPSAWPGGATTNLAATYVAWGQDWSTYGASFIAKCNQNGLIPFVELEPWHSGANWNVTPLFTDITGGNWDTWLLAIGSSIAASGRPVILTFAHEFNVSGQYPWAQGMTGSGPGGGTLSPSQWQAGWKYVHDKVNSTAGGLALWMWAPNTFTGGTTIDPSPYFPGLSYCDMVSLDGYPNTQYGQSLGTFSGQFGPAVQAIRNLGWTGSIFISETNLHTMVSSGGESITNFVTDMHAAGISGIFEFEEYYEPQMTSAEWAEYNTAVAKLYGASSTPPAGGGGGTGTGGTGTGGTGGTGSSSYSYTQTLYDGFTGTSLNTGLWKDESLSTASGRISVSGGKLNLVAESDNETEVDALQYFDSTSGLWAVQWSHTGTGTGTQNGTECYFGFADKSDNYLELQIWPADNSWYFWADGHGATVGSDLGNQNAFGTAGWTNGDWIGIGNYNINGDNRLHVYSSPDAITWTEIASCAVTGPINMTQVEFFLGTWQMSGTSTWVSVFQNASTFTRSATTGGGGTGGGGTGGGGTPTPPTSPNLTVTATAGGNSSPGILLHVEVYDNATLPASLNVNSQSGTGTHSAAITPAVTGSIAVAAEINIPSTAASPVAATGNTALDAVSDTISNSSQPYGYGTFRSTATLTAGTAFTAGSSDNALGGVAVLEIQPNGTIAVDPSSPAVVSSVSQGSNAALGNGVTTVTTAGFAPPTGSLLVAFVAAAGSPYGQASMTVTDSYGLAWTEAVRANSSGNGYAGIWVAFAPAALSVPAATLPQAYDGFAYSANATVTGGYGPYTYALASGSLPAGLKLAANGQVYGTPSAAGTSTFTVTVTDSFGNTATSGTQTLTVSSTPPLTPYVAGSWTAQGAPYVYGTTTVYTATGEHDWVLVVASWTNSEDSGAVSYVSDSAHNVYRPIGISNTGPANVQAWMAPNAKAANRVYISQSAFVRDLAVTVLDIRNMTAGYTVDVSAPPAHGTTTTTFTLSATTTGPDLVIAAAVSTAQKTALPSSWSPVNVSSAAGTASQVVGWHYDSAPTSESVTVTLTGTQAGGSSYAGLLVAFSANAAPVISGPNPAWPHITLQAAFGFQPGNPSSVPVWTDITSRFLGLNGQRGRNFELDELAAADLEIDLDNFDGALTPFNSASPYYPNVTLVTPLQLLADWQGRRYAIATGIITAMPQTFDFQRGLIKATLSDDYSKLPQVLLPSCMISEMLYDQPLNLWPLNDAQNALQASNWSGRSTVVLVPANGRFGGGSTANTPTTGFGNQAAVNGTATYPYALNGTTDSVYGNYAVASHVNYLAGTSLVDRNDSTLPLTATGATYECWAMVEVTTPATAVLLTLTDEKGINGGGLFFNLEVTKGAVLIQQQGRSWSARASVSKGNLIDDHWHHYVVTVDKSGNVQLYVDGVRLSSFKGQFPSGTPNTLSILGDPSDKTGLGYFNGLMANVAVYDRVLDPERIHSHWVSAASGFNAELSGSRIQRVLTYARWAGPQAIEPGLSHQQLFNYLGGGYGTAGIGGAIGQYATGGGSAAVDNGAQADITIQDIAAGELGLLFVAADGTLTFRQRDSRYNPPVAGTVGDMDWGLNNPADYLNWPAAGGLDCSITLSSAWTYSGGSSALITVTTQPPSQAYPYSGTFPVSPGQSVGGSMWVMSPGGCYAQASIDFSLGGTYVSGSYSTPVWCPPGVPVFLTLSPSAVPSGVNNATIHPAIVNAPAAGTQLYVSQVRASPGGFQVSYENDIEVSTDIQYLFNDIAVSRNVDQATYRARDVNSRNSYYPRVFTRTIYTSTNDPQAVVDCAQWLLADYSQPKLRITRLTVNPAANPALWPFVLGTDIGDVIQFQRNPVGAAAITGTFMVIGIQPNITKDTATFGYTFAPIFGTVLTLDDPVFGLVGSNGLGF